MRARHFFAQRENRPGEVGDMIGAIRETVTKTLDEFQQAGLVELCRGRIILRDVVGLQARMDE
jgi:hypothetical protein